MIPTQNNSLSIPLSVSTSCLLWKCHQMTSRWYKHITEIILLERIVNLGMWGDLLMENCWEGWYCPSVFLFFFSERIWWKSRIWVRFASLNNFLSHLGSRHIVYTSHVGSLYIQWRDTLVPFAVGSQSWCWGGTVILDSPSSGRLTFPWLWIAKNVDLKKVLTERFSLSVFFTKTCVLWKFPDPF